MFRVCHEFDSKQRQFVELWRWWFTVFIHPHLLHFSPEVAFKCEIICSDQLSTVFRPLTSFPAITHRVGPRPLINNSSPAKYVSRLMKFLKSRSHLQTWKFETNYYHFFRCLCGSKLTSLNVVFFGRSNVSTILQLSLKDYSYSFIYLHNNIVTSEFGWIICGEIRSCWISKHQKL